MLALHGINKKFGENEVLNSIHFNVMDGEFVSLIGPSGSGKSTLFNLIGGMLTPNEGSIEFNGEDIKGRKGHISYMPQHASLFPWRTVLQNTLLGQELQGLKEKTVAKNMLIKAGLGDVINRYPHELSGGMQQRVSFIRALLSPQTLMCLDEPFSALDEFTRLDMQKWLLSIWEQEQQSILFITHSVEEALFLSDKIIVLSAGPAIVKQIVDVPFQRPRKEDILLTTEFLKWKKKVLEIVKD